MTKENSRLGDDLAQGAFLDDPEFLRGIVKNVIQEILETEMTNHIGAVPYERSETRRGQRNGYKPRALRTRVGEINLLVPQDRDGTFSSQVFSRYQRNEKALVLALMEMYIKGVSTRKVTDITEALCGTSFSKSLVSHLSSGLDGELSAWRSRPLCAASYPYLYVDARYEDVRVGGQISSQGVLIVKGVRIDGKREILAVEVADTESEATYSELFKSLKARGLSGVILVVSDDHKGLKAAAKRHFQGAAWQRCQVHFMRNITKMVGKSHRRKIAAGLKEVFQMPDRKLAKETAAKLCDAWQKSHPKVAEHIDEHIEECLSCLAFPAVHRIRIRTTNGLERLNEEIKRRSRVVRIFPNRESCLRLVSALCAEQSDEWVSGKIYLNMEELTDFKQIAERKERELTAVF